MNITEKKSYWVKPLTPTAPKLSNYGSFYKWTTGGKENYITDRRQASRNRVFRLAESPDDALNLMQQGWLRDQTNKRTAVEVSNAHLTMKPRKRSFIKRYINKSIPRPINSSPMVKRLAKGKGLLGAMITMGLKMAGTGKFVEVMERMSLSNGVLSKTRVPVGGRYKSSLTSLPNPVIMGKHN
jgi:hypothetical protein